MVILNCHDKTNYYQFHFRAVNIQAGNFWDRLEVYQHYQVYNICSLILYA